MSKQKYIVPIDEEDHNSQHEDHDDMSIEEQNSSEVLHYHSRRKYRLPKIFCILVIILIITYMFISEIHLNKTPIKTQLPKSNPNLHHQNDTAKNNHHSNSSLHQNNHTSEQKLQKQPNDSQSHKNHQNNTSQISLQPNNSSNNHSHISSSNNSSTINNNTLQNNTKIPKEIKFPELSKIELIGPHSQYQHIPEIGDPSSWHYSANTDKDKNSSRNIISPQSSFCKIPKKNRNSSLLNINHTSDDKLSHFDYYCFFTDIQVKLKWQNEQLQSITKEKPYFYKNFLLNQTQIPLRKNLDDPSQYQTKKNYHTLQAATFSYQTYHNSLRIRPLEKILFELPKKFPYTHYAQETQLTQNNSSVNFNLTIDQKTGFYQSLLVQRKDTQEIIFDTQNRKFFFNEDYIEFEYQIPTKYLFGLGERNYKLLIEPGEYSMSIQDDSGQLEGRRRGFNAHGYHPMYLMREKSGKYHILYMRSGRPIAVKVSYDKTLLWRIQGGPFEMHIFTCDYNPELCIKQYHTYTGGWQLPAIWFLGLHIAKWGYKSYDEIETVISNHNKNSIPFESVCPDITPQVISEIIGPRIFSINFSWDQSRFPRQKMEQKFKEQDLKLIVMLDPTYCSDSMNNRNPAYTQYDGDIKSISVQDAYYKGPLVVVSYCGKAYLPDFFHPKTRDFWYAMMDYQEKENCNYDGVFLDKNEMGNYCVIFDQRYCKYNIDSVRKYYNMPFNAVGKNIYDEESVALDSIHYDDLIEMDIRNYAHMIQSEMTYRFMKEKKNILFPYVISRASAPGLGRYAVHWQPDSERNTLWYATTIGTMLSYQLFGLGISGFDVCGAARQSTGNSEQLCLRYYQIALFVPLIRNNHFGTEAIDELESYSPTFIEAVKGILQLRLSHIKSYYSWVYLQNRTGTLIRPTFFNFQNEKNFDENLFDDKNLDESFMLFENIIVFYTQDIKNSQIRGYFPDARWYNPISLIEEKNCRQSYKNYTMNPTDLPIYFYRGGYVWFTQEVNDSITRIKQLNNKFKAIVALPDYTKMDGQSNNNSSSSSIWQSTSYGYLIDAPNYDDQTISKRCVERGNDCLMEMIVRVYYDSESKLGEIQIKNFRLNHQKGIEENERNIFISEMIFMGFKFNETEGIERPRVRNNEDVIFYQSFYDKGNTLQLTFNFGLLLYHDQNIKFDLMDESQFN